MNKAATRKLESLRADYESVRGYPFKHFFCPILFRDDNVQLCRAHIVNSGFRDSDRSWTIQRADVDNFYGSIFESDFLEIQDRGSHRPIDVLTDRELTRRLRPRLISDGKQVDHYIAEGPIPPEFTELTLTSPSSTVRLALKLTPSEALTTINSQLEIHIEKDVRLAALSSCIKAAHLTLFDMIGYQYGLSLGGYIVGHDILGKFFLENAKHPKSNILENSREHFLEYVNMVRPIQSAPSGLQGTVSDRLLYICMMGQRAWALIVIVRTEKLLHAVLMPMLEDADSAAHFVAFLRQPFPRLTVRLARYEGDRWETDTEDRTFHWPDANFI